MRLRLFCVYGVGSKHTHSHTSSGENVDRQVCGPDYLAGPRLRNEATQPQSRPRQIARGRRGGMRKKISSSSSYLFLLSAVKVKRKDDATATPAACSNPSPRGPGVPAAAATTSSSPHLHTRSRRGERWCRGEHGGGVRDDGEGAPLGKGAGGAPPPRPRPRAHLPRMGQVRSFNSMSWFVC